ncbi:MAG: chorismate mutase [Vulcanibacillus sp.]
MKDLESIREEIDKIDEEIVGLFEKRMEMVQQIANHKEKFNQPILHKDREQEVLKKCKSKLSNKDFENELEELYECVMRISKRIQIKLLDTNKENEINK